jgi:DNA polymerase-3 subunit delta'
MNSSLDKIPGQGRVKKILHSFINSKSIPHAFLFTGIEGTGKDFAAIKFAQAIVEQERTVNSEKNSRLIGLLSEPLFKFIFPLPRGRNETDSSSPTEKLTNDELEIVQEQLELKTNNPFIKISIPRANSIKINSIRDIKKFLSLNYDEISYRFVIISDAHLMNDAAQNALLKNLEEPPQKVIFILVTSSFSKLRPTIVSRCWRINFDPLSELEIVDILTKYFNIDQKIAEEAAPFSMGSLQTALSLVDLEIHALKAKIISVLRYSFGRKFNSAFDELNLILADQLIVNFPMIINMINTWINDLQKHKLNVKEYFYKDHLETLEKFNAKFPNASLNEITYQLERLASLQRNNINPSLLAASLIFELSSVVLLK